MGDGYFSPHLSKTNGTYSVGEGSTKICTYNFTKEEVLIGVLNTNFGIKATTKKRTNPDGSVKWRINISRVSMDRVRSLVTPYFIPEMLYKLGTK